MSKPKQRPKKQKGFSVIDGLIVLVVAALIVVVSVFAYQKISKGSGDIYFLRKDNGKLDLVMANIYKPGTRVAVAGVGYATSYYYPWNTIDVMYNPGYLNAEDAYQKTAILARPDWKFVALRTQRDLNGLAKLYVYSDAKKSLTVVDQSKASFAFIGWVGGNLLYTSTPYSVALLQSSGNAVIKSYNPGSQKTTILINASNDCTGSPYIVDSKIVCADNGSNFSAIYEFNADGSHLTRLLNVPEMGVFTNNFYSPNSVYFSLYPSSGAATKYYVYTNGKISSTTNALANNQAYHFYIASPSGKQTAWYEVVNGKHVIYIGNSDGKNVKQVATLSASYEPYAWYGSTLIISKDGNTLYKFNSKTASLTELSTYTPSAKGYNIAMAGYPGPTYGYAGIF